MSWDDDVAVVQVGAPVPPKPSLGSLIVLPHDKERARHTHAKILARVGRGCYPLLHYLPLGEDVLGGKTYMSFSKTDRAVAHRDCFLYLLAQTLRGAGTMYLHNMRRPMPGSVDRYEFDGVLVIVYMHRGSYDADAARRARGVVDQVQADANAAADNDAADANRANAAREGAGAGAPAPLAAAPAGAADAVNAAPVAGAGAAVAAAAAAAAAGAAQVVMRATTENLSWKDWNYRRLYRALKSSHRGMAGLAELRLGTSEGKHDTMLGVQAPSWVGLEGFVDTARLAKILDLLVTSGEDARDHRFDDARSTPELIGHLFSAEVAAQLYVNSVQSRSRNSLRTQTEVDAMVREEVERLRHPVLLFAPPLDPSESPDAPDGNQTFRLPRKIASPVALVMHARFDLTPPIDTDSDAYLSFWRQQSATNALFKERLADGTFRPSAAFAAHFLDTLGATCKETLGEDLEAILDEWRRKARRTLPRLQRTSPAGTVDFMNKVAKMMSNVMVKGSKLSAGLEGAVEHVTTEMSRGGTYSTILSRYVHPVGTAHHLASFAGTFYAALDVFNRMSVETRAPMFLLYVLMCNAGYDPLRGVLVPSVAIGGHPGCGKSHMGEELQHFVCQSEDADAKTRNADTSSRVLRGIFQFTDEMKSEDFGVPPGDEWQRVRAICLKGVESPCANMPGHNNVGLTSKTKRATTIIQLDMVENKETGTRDRHETRFTVVKIVGTAGCTNQHLVLPNRFFRRWVTLAIRFKPNVQRDFVANAGEDLGTRTVREEGVVNITIGCRGINAGMHYLNALHAAGGIVFTNTAFLQSLNLASGDAMGVAGLCVRSPGPILKAMMFADALLKMDMLITIGTGLGAPRTTDRANFTEALTSARVLAYSRPMHAAWAFEYVMGEQLGQVAPAGLAAVVDGLRFIFGGTDEKAKWRNLASGTDDGVRLTLSPNQDQKGMSDYAWCPDFFPPGDLGEESRCLYVAQV